MREVEVGQTEVMEVMGVERGGVDIGGRKTNTEGVNPGDEANNFSLQKSLFSVELVFF
jgi:hypothetical protein